MADPERVSDGRLLQRMASGDDEAVGELYDRFGHAAFRLAFRVTGNASLAEEAVQEAFVDVWRGAAGFDSGRSKTMTWILTIVHRRAVDLLRREGRHRERASRLAEEIHVEATVESSGLTDDRERIRTALKQLPTEQRRALVLTYFGGLTHAEAAEKLGEPVGTIKSRIFAAMTRLRDVLEERDQWSGR